MLFGLYLCVAFACGCIVGQKEGFGPPRAGVNRQFLAAWLRYQELNLGPVEKKQVL